MEIPASYSSFSRKSKVNSPDRSLDLCSPPFTWFSFQSHAAAASAAELANCLWVTPDIETKEVKMVAPAVPE